MKQLIIFAFVLFFLENCGSKKNPANMRRELDPAVIKWIDSANIKRNQGDWKRALANYDNAITLDPKSDDAYVGRGMLRYETSNTTGALMDLSRAIELNPKNATAYFDRGLIRQGERDYKGATLDYSETIKMNAKNPSAYHNRALVYHALGDLHAALSDYSKAIELDPNGMSYFNRADTKDSLKDYRGAIEDYTKAIENDPKLEEGFLIHDSYLKRGRARYKVADYPGTIEDFTKLINDENFGEAYYWRGMAKIGLQQIESGCLDLSMAIDLGFEKARVAKKEKCKRFDDGD
ncbi:MAG TPA: tetratricopeptide repeat protein [Cyclobacteriaceae bacterium]|jgi:tetratricopeptide (TPR) repeat protein|nr:tetratricopeptide repeat protein [Cyclobacteriaceae bacterium]